MDLHHFLSHGALNSTGQGSGTWGWISDDGREFAAIGQEDGAAFVEIKDGKLVLVARLPQPPTALVSNWREMVRTSWLVFFLSNANDFVEF